ncbi:hypothetical protein EG240_02975 [Paenimyroides tangerinum]|uniref:Uncharacterized protein n=1 Tax=Paenimyroides tangerinum TaxID=2488728 RepID=A0A3P3WD95_9FLAO|nr:hypothetical protein [Paenimyroides tangerinum]RRJ92378.1 hypothetical protein EG240_02975 [Paenimyroides tangerinum]
MLTSKKDEIQQRLNSILQRLSGITFVPDNWNEALFWETIEESGFSQEEILNEDENVFFQKFIENEWPWEQMETFTDILVGFEKKQPNELLKERAKHLYQFILNESKMFSFEIMNKMAKL